MEYQQLQPHLTLFTNYLIHIQYNKVMLCGSASRTIDQACMCAHSCIWPSLCVTHKNSLEKQVLQGFGELKHALFQIVRVITKIITKMALRKSFSSSGKTLCTIFFLISCSRNPTNPFPNPCLGRLSLAVVSLYYFFATQRTINKCY